MQVSEIMTQQIGSCRPESSLEDAAQLMWNRDCGVVPVTTGDGINRPVGIITDRDICMCAMFQGKPLRELRVDQAMSREVRACRPQDTIAQAGQLMRDAQVRRLPVVDGTGSLIGILSLSDIAREAAREEASPSKYVTDGEVNFTMATICQPSGFGAHA